MISDPAIFDEFRSIQSAAGFIAASELDALSRRRNLPLAYLYGLVSFYPHFRLAPPPRVDVRLCGDMTCHLRGAAGLDADLRRAFAGRPPQELAIGPVSCLGRCDRAPAAAINEQIVDGLTRETAEALIAAALAGTPAGRVEPAPARARLLCDPYDAAERYGALERVVADRAFEGVIATLKAADLRGLGGAGFPTGLKWEAVRNAGTGDKYVVCNADESEPGTIKDRFILDHAPHLVIEALVLAGLTVGAQRGFVYIRHEYAAQERVLELELARCRAAGLVGPSILGTDLAFELEVFVSPGGYICGEETALLEALEGKRAEPRNKPPFPVSHGLWGRPTLINNVETLANVPSILVRGVDAWRSAGVGGAAGIKLVGVSGHVERPGVFQVPMGTPYRTLIDEHAGGVLDGRPLKAFAPSGPSSGYLPAAMADLPLEFRAVAQAGSMVGSGAVVVCAEGTCMLDMALNATRFLRNESCGKCVPCRVGSQKLVELLEGWTRGRGSAAEIALLDELAQTLRLTSICGLGQVVPAPIASVLLHFRDEIEAHAFAGQCPSGDLHAVNVTLTIDGREVSVAAGCTVFDAARLNGIAVPTLCHQQNETPVGVCRLCVVEVRGARVQAAACVRQVEPGMVVDTQAPAVLATRRTLLELLLADHPSPCARERASGDCELERHARDAGVGLPRYARHLSPRGQDASSAVIAVDHEACILCDRCIRGCNEVRENFVLGRSGKGRSTGIAFDSDLPMGHSSCVSCGECMVSCPTGALTNLGTVGTALPAGQPVDPQELLRFPWFGGVSGTFLALNRGAIVRRTFRAGEIICREGDFGSTAFYVLEGRVQIYLASRIGHVKTEGGARGWLSRLTSRLAGRSEDHREDEQAQRFIPIDAAVDLAYDNPVAELGPGELFGEMTCLNKYPRSATVRAATDCTVYEMLRNVLDIMLRNASFREQVERRYRERALDTHLRSVPTLADLPPEAVDALRDRVALLRFNPGQAICTQGEPADSFYLVRVGFVKVSQRRPDGELVLAYLSRGGHFGEIGLLGGGVRTATCTALDHVEVVRIAGPDFHALLEQHPAIALRLESTARERLEQNRRQAADVGDRTLASFLDQGLMQAQSLLVLDLERCTRCDACVRACADAHDGVTRLVREGLRFEQYLVATSCRQCRDPLCMVGCPVGSIRRRDSLEILIEDWCIGCGLCARNCPYGNINLHPFAAPDGADDPGRQVARVKHKATTCDLCSEHAEPSCVYACPHDAALRIEPNRFFADLLRGGGGEP